MSAETTSPASWDRDKIEKCIELVAKAETERFDDLLRISELDPAHDLRFCDWSRVDFANCDLRGCDFTGANLIGCRFEGARITGARFDLAQMDRAALWRAQDWQNYERSWTRLARPPSGRHLPDFAVFSDAPFTPEMVVLSGGEFLMGSPDSDSEAFSDEKPQHRVQIGYRLAVGRYPVTFEEWDVYVADGETDYRPHDQGWGRGRRPVIDVSWNDAQQYVVWLNQKTGQTYRLLSEAEWEYAVRAGTITRRWWGNDITPQNANYGDSNIRKTTEVGNYPESPFKLYDMLGNVWEWVEDCWNNSYAGAPNNGEAWIAENCRKRVLRGGSWGNVPGDVRSAGRDRDPAADRSNGVGFRVARTF